MKKGLIAVGVFVSSCVLLPAALTKVAEWWTWLGMVAEAAAVLAGVVGVCILTLLGIGLSAWVTKSGGK